MAIQGVIDKDRAIKSLRETIGKLPDYVYLDDHDNCVYADYGRDDDGFENPESIPDIPPLGPSCAVGQALFHEGAPLSLLAAMDDGVYGPITMFHEKLPLTHGAVVVYAAAQGAQDDGGNWEQALEMAELAYAYASEHEDGCDD